MKENDSKIPIRFGWPWASWPGVRDSPNTLIAKITISRIRGTRIRLRIRKMLADVCGSESSGTVRTTRGSFPGSGSASNLCQNASNGFAMAGLRLAALEGDGLDDEQHDRHHVGEQRATRQGDHRGRHLRGHPRG